MIFLQLTLPNLERSGDGNSTELGHVFPVAPKLAGLPGVTTEMVAPPQFGFFYLKTICHDLFNFFGIGTRQRDDMISHALTIITNEMNLHLSENYGGDDQQVGLGNLAEGIAANSGTPGSGGVSRNRLYLSVVNIREEKTLRNQPNYNRNDMTMRVAYENAPVFINLMLLMTATHSAYTNALLALSRAIRFFQSKNVFTQDNVAPASITNASPLNPLDQLESFKLIMDLYSPSMEEVNHLWGTLGGKQYPFAMYMLRMLELRFRSVQSESGLITSVTSNFNYKKAGGS